jgi:hypothetical protein
VSERVELESFDSTAVLGCAGDVSISVQYQYEQVSRIRGNKRRVCSQLVCIPKIQSSAIQSASYNPLAVVIIRLAPCQIMESELDKVLAKIQHYILKSDWQAYLESAPMLATG